ARPRLRIETEQVVDVERRIYLRAEDAIVVEADAFQRPERVARIALEKRKIEDRHVFKLHEDVGAVKQALRISLRLAGPGIDELPAKERFLRQPFLFQRRVLHEDF